MAIRRNVSICFRRGRYVVDYRDPKGKRLRPSFETEAEAEKHKRKVEMMFDGYIFTETKNESEHKVYDDIPVKKAIQQYRNTITQMGNTKRTEQYHFEDLFLWLNNEAKIVLLGDVTLLSMEQFRTKILDGSLSWKKRSLKASSINRMFGTYSAFFNKCVSWGLIAKNPIETLKDLPEETPEIKSWSVEDMKVGLSALPLWAREALYFMVETICREVDLSRLKWGDVDFAAQQVRLYSYKGAKVRKDYPPMSDALCAFMRGLKERAKREFRARDEDLVFLNSKGRQITTDALGHMFRKYRDKCGLKGFTLYGIRHGGINLLVDLGVQPRDIQVLARHAKFETTTRYTDRSNEKLRPTVNLASEAKKNIAGFGR